MTVLQIIGGLFYLLNKVFLSRRERTEEDAKRRWSILAWASYLIGLPFIAILFAHKSDWIVFAIELGGAPAMVIGLIVAIKGSGRSPPWLDWIAIAAIPLGLTASIYEFGGITTLTQLLEIGLTTGFLIGTYRLAKENPDGYLWFLLMNGSCATLVFIQEYYVIFGQQIISIYFVLDAYFMQRRKRRYRQASPY